MVINVNLSAAEWLSAIWSQAGLLPEYGPQHILRHRATCRPAGTCASQTVFTVDPTDTYVTAT